MLRLLFFLIVVGGLSYVAVWFSDHDGMLRVEWLGYLLEMRVTSALLFLLASVVVLVVAAEIFLWFRAAPRRLTRMLREQRRDKGLMALTQGFAAIAAGDVKQSKQLAKRTQRYLGAIPLSTLLAAQAAQLEGNQEDTKKHYKALLANDETELIALKGLLMEAKKEGNIDEAMILAKRAVALNPDMKWAVQILIDLYKHKQQWEDAQVLLESALRRRVVRIEEAKRTSAILYLARSQEAEQRQKKSDALHYAQQAYKQLPHFVPVVVQLVQLYDAADRISKAAKLVETTWRRQPHPDLMHAYVHLYQDQPKGKLLKRVERLVQSGVDTAEGNYWVARIAFEAKDYDKARNYVKLALSQSETRSLCLLMADVEERDGDDLEVVRSWRERADRACEDPAWLCGGCGKRSDVWEVSCGHCQAFDGFEWKGEEVKLVA